MDWKSAVILLGISIAFIIAKTLYDRGKDALSIFPDLNSVKIKYRDKTAVGYSTKSWHTKVGGASRSMDIIVTDQELWLRSFLWLAGITQHHDLIHRIPLNKITRVREKGAEITLDFRNEKGQARQVVINTRDNSEFLNALHGKY
jgi:hypothetical protein